MRMLVRMSVLVPAVLLMRRAAVDVEFHTLDVLPLCAIVVHVEVADVQLAQLPFERAGFHAEINERADHHVAADAGDAVEEEGFHGKLRVERRGRLSAFAVVNAEPSSVKAMRAEARAHKVVMRFSA